MHVFVALRAFVFLSALKEQKAHDKRKRQTHPSENNAGPQPKSSGERVWTEFGPTENNQSTFVVGTPPSPAAGGPAWVGCRAEINIPASN